LEYFRGFGLPPFHLPKTHNKGSPKPKNTDHPRTRMGTRKKKREEEEEEPLPSLSHDNANGSDSQSEEGSERGDDSSRYEQARNQRIKENMERMNKLGLFDLSLKLKRPKQNPLPKKKKAIQPNHSPQRRSSRYAFHFSLYICFSLCGTSKGATFLGGYVPFSPKMLPFSFLFATGNPLPFWRQRRREHDS